MKTKIIDWIRSYFHNNATEIAPAIVGISGGKDSSVVAILCKEALGKDRVLGVLMPQGNQHDIDCSYKLIEHLDIKGIEINIQHIMEMFHNALPEVMWNNYITRTGIPPRVRMTILYAVSGFYGGRVANTSNRSEIHVGYTSKWGDSVGDFAPIANLTVSQVIQLGKDLGLPSILTDKTPEDGLSGKTDEENIGISYEDIDGYLLGTKLVDVKVTEHIRQLNNKHAHKRCCSIPTFLP